MASAIFQESLHASRERLLSMITHPNFDLWTALYITRSKFCEIDDLLNCKDPSLRRFIRIRAKRATPNVVLETCKFEHLEDNQDEQGLPPIWTSIFNVPTGSCIDYTWFATIWLRINVAASFVAPNDNSIQSEKVERFLVAHIPVIRYLDLLQDPNDNAIDQLHIESLYKPLGRSYYDEDRNSIQRETTQHRVRETPLSVIQRAFPDTNWVVEEVVGELELMDPIDQCAKVQLIREHGYDLIQTNDWGNYKLYFAAALIMVRCKIAHTQLTEDPEIRDALWFYHGCFIDFMYNCKGMSDKELLTPKGNQDRTPMELYYPHDNRVFTAYDLPDVFHVIMTIPLWGEQSVPSFKLGKFIQKSMPFCCARRTLISRTDKSISEDLAFWNIFSAVFYCLLMDTYPHDMSPHGRKFDLPYLLRAKELASNRDLLRDALSRQSQKVDFISMDIFNKENDKGCHIVFTAFRMWVIMLSRNQHHYISHARKCLDWDDFCQQTFEMAFIIRSTDLPKEDPFQYARMGLTECNKESQNLVYRYKKADYVTTILEKLTNMLEKELYCQTGHYEPLDTSIKEKILNIFIRIPRGEWFTPLALSVLKVPEYGGITNEAVLIVLKTIDIYNDTAKPKEFENQFDELNTHDFQVITWFFYVISVLQKIEFQSLSQDQVDSIDFALKHVHRVLYPGQTLPSHAYTVFVTLCCKEIKTLQGNSEYGHQDIGYDMDRRLFICTKGHKKVTMTDFGDMEEEQVTKKRNRNQRKSFNHIPCKDNPALDISLKGFMLIYGNQGRFMHCPQCGAFHKYDWSTGWSGSETGRYRCKSCIEKERTIGNWSTYHYTCGICGTILSEASARKNTLTVVDPLSPNGVMDAFQRFYFCKRHYNVGCRKAWGIPKDQLFKIVSARALQKTIRKL